ncbi:MAG: methyltransferase FkbM [Microgenomates group bacterium Gr01-1014_16]|nr:MAG: methyltransferase FkbM [Microgenomates group bacterium Gr01-1014_16]
MFYGQFKTDKYISEFFAPNFIGVCIDIGAARPIRNNNTYYFEREGWTVYCIEPNKNYVQLLTTARKNVFNFACGAQNLDEVEFTICTLAGGNQEAVSSLKVDERLLEKHKIYNPTLEKISVNLQTLDSFIEEQEIKKIDFVSIDTEGTEIDVLTGFNLQKHKPRLLVIENNFNDPKIENYLNNFGYIKAKRVVINDFYIYV